MKPLHVMFLEGATADVREELLAVINKSASLDEFIQLWLSTAHGEISVSLSNDTNVSAAPCLSVVAHQDDEEVAAVFYALEPLRVLFPDVKPVDSYVKGFDSFGRCIFDDDAFDAFESELGYEYCEDLCGPLGPRESIVKVILSYVTLGNGEVHISRYQHPDPEDAPFESEDLDPDTILSLSLLYRAPREIKGCVPMFGTFLYVHAHESSPS